MPLSAELARAIQVAHEAVRAHPEHRLDRSYRAHLCRARPTARSAGATAWWRGPLSADPARAAGVRHALPTWERVWPDDIRPRELLQRAEAALTSTPEEVREAAALRAIRTIEAQNLTMEPEHQQHAERILFDAALHALFGATYDSPMMTRRIPPYWMRMLIQKHGTRRSGSRSPSPAISPSPALPALTRAASPSGSGGWMRPSPPPGPACPLCTSHRPHAARAPGSYPLY
jgi:hypothetical protein